MKNLVGYYYDIYNPETVFCVECAEKHSTQNNLEIEDYLPLFYYHDVDSPLHCDECEKLIPLTMTEEGIDYILMSLIGYVVDGHGRQEVITEWLREYEHDIVQRMEKDAEWFFENIIMEVVK